jgi:hypothetical protein
LIIVTELIEVSVRSGTRILDKVAALAFTKVIRFSKSIVWGIPARTF